VEIKRTHSLYKLLGLCSAALLLGACSSEPATWTKSSSPWEKSSPQSQAAAPAAETYKAELEMPAESASSEAGSSDVELSYQTEPVDSFAPAAAVDEPLEETPVPLEEPTSAGDMFMDQPADYYTLQLIASVDIDRVMRFAEEEQISTQYIVATERDGVVWHVLLLDVYPDYSSAVAARDEIAPSLNNAPWIRRVGSVQKLVVQ